MQNLKYFFSLVRWPNLLLLAANQSLAFIFLLDHNWNRTDLQCFFLLLVGTLCITAAGYVINDYHDQKIDLINKPDKMIIGTYISRRDALLIYILLNAVALAVGFWLSTKTGLIFLFCEVLLWVYAVRLKKIPFVGNFVVSFLTSFSLILLGIVFKDFNKLIYFYSFFAFATTLLREIVKDCEDIIGDQALNCRTLPIVFGFKKTKLLLIFLIVANIVLIFIITKYLDDNILFKFSMLISLFLCVIIYRILVAKQKNDWKKISLHLKIIMLVGVLSMVLVGKQVVL